jgi:hypothetical protein
LTKKGNDSKTISEHISSKDVPRIQEEVDKYVRFRQLMADYADICEEMSQFTVSIEDECKKN